jgi:iron complex outermembrane receptor protein
MAILAAAATQAQAADATAAASTSASSTTGLQEVVVTARRVNESMQKVPVAVTVISQRSFDLKGTFTPQDLAAEVPGLSVAASTADRDNVIYSIRGQNIAYGTLFPAVITYFSEVPVTQITAGQFFDLANVQVLRGPQGVLFGRVTDGGNVMVYPKRPSNTFGGYAEVKVGDYGLNDYAGALNVPVVQDKLMVRGAFEVDRRDGFTTNLYNGQKLDNIASEGYRIGVTFRPADGLENYFVVAYQHTHDNGTAAEIANVNPTALNSTTAGVFGLFPGVYGINSVGNVVPYQAGLTPLTSASYLANVQAQLARQQQLGPRQVYLTSASFDNRDNLYLVNSTSWDISPDIQLKNIFGYTKVVDHEASNFAGLNGGLVLTCHSSCLSTAGSGSGIPFNAQEQLSEEIRLAGKSLGRKLSWSAGFYTDYQFPGQAFQNDTVNVGVLHRDGVQYNVNRSRAVYGFAEYDASSWVQGLKFNAGVRYTEDTIKTQEATYIAPIAGTNTLAQVTSVLAQELAGTPKAPYAPIVAAATVNFAIPFGQCVSGGALSAFGPFTCNQYTGGSHALTWTAGASYELPSGQLLYVKGSRGYRPGGVNGTAPAGLSPSYAPEYDTSVEIGAKGDWNVGDVRVRTDIALYHDDYVNIQKNVVLPGPVPVSQDANVASATIQGLEFEGTIVPFSGLTVGLNLDFTDAHYNGGDPLAGQAGDPCDPTQSTTVGFCNGNMLGFTPHTQVSVSADYKLPLDEQIGTITLGGRYYYQSKEALTDTSMLAPSAIEPGYGLLDLNATWSNFFGKPIDLAFFMTNATDKVYRTGADDLMQNASLGINANIYAPPRMFGFSLKYHFGGG